MGFRRRFFAMRLRKCANVVGRWKYAPDGGPAAFDEKYDVSFDGEGPVRMVRRYEDGGRPVIVMTTRRRSNI